MASSKSSKYVYFFGGKKADGKAEMKSLLGGKGANLAEMVNIGIPVPPVSRSLLKYVLIIMKIKIHTRKNLKNKYMIRSRKLKK